MSRSRKISSSAASPRPNDCAETAHRRHTVQFYKDDSFLIDVVGRFIGAALDTGDAAVVIASEEHRKELAQRLWSKGVDLGAIMQRGRYVALDASETLAKIMVNGQPDAVRFTQVIGPVIEQAYKAAESEHPRVAAFGEMVTLLWAEKKGEEAILLEKLWNDLAKTHSFSLHCAYPLAGFSTEEGGEMVRRICAEHSDALPAETYGAHMSEDERMLNIIFLQQKAQALETEIAQRKKVENKLQMREAELNDFLESAVVGMHWVSADGTILWANQTELHFMGYDRDEYVGHNIKEFYTDPSVAEDILLRLSRGEEMHGYEARVQRKDGSIRDVRVYSNVFTEDGRFVHTRCFTIDITRQKEADEARRRLAAIVESSDDVIASKDLNGIVTSWNASAERIFGYKAEEIVGRPITLIIPPELHDDEKMILSKIRRGEKIDHFETVRVTKTGERVDISLTVSPIKDESGRVIGVAKIARDITERKKMERALHLTEKLASVGKLAATIAHEINNPLEAITNLLFLAKRDAAGNAKVSRYLDLADQELNRVAHIARQTLGFYRDTSSPEMIDVCEILDDLLLLYARRLETRGITVVKQYDGKKEVSAVAGQIRQVFSNLIANAIDALQKGGGSLTVCVRESRSWSDPDVTGVRVIFADTGSGISTKDREHLFQPFFTTKKDVGTGLGLWITHGIVEKHGGSIRFRSRTDAPSGTVFSLFLPECAPQMDPSKPARLTEAGDASSNFRIRNSKPDTAEPRGSSKADRATSGD